MKKLNLILISIASLSLFACNMGDTGGDSTIAYINITSNTCKTITKHGQCTVNVTYYAPANSPVVQNQTFLQLTGLTGYSDNINQQCSSGNGYFKTTQQSCIITITNLDANVSSAQTASLSPHGYASTTATFTVGGGA